MSNSYADKIEAYLAGSAKIRSAVSGLTAAQLTAFPVPGTWSIQQNVIHLLDSDLVASDRMKRIIAQDKPLLIGYDETAFSQKLFYHEQSAEDALTMFELNRRATAAILKRLPDEAFARAGVHNERGLVTLGDMLNTYIRHVDNHLVHVLRKRAMVGG
jgi:uncharacterized damage-inducible protein DinB